MSPFNHTCKSFLAILITIVTLVLSSCYNDCDEKCNFEPEVWMFPTQITAFLSQPNTRIGYEDINGTIKQKWQLGDEFKVYVSSGEYRTYTLESIDADNPSKGIFKSSGTPLSGSKFYCVYQNGSQINVEFTSNVPSYNLSMLNQVQPNIVGNEGLSHLQKFDLVIAIVNNIEQPILFESQGVLMTFSFNDIPANSETPQNITVNAFCNGKPINIFKNNYSSNYNSSELTLTLSGYDDATSSITGYIMTPPFTIPADCELYVTLNYPSSSIGKYNEYDLSKVFDKSTDYTFEIDIWSNIYTQEMETAVLSNKVSDSKKPVIIDGIYMIDNAWNLAWLKQQSTNNALTSSFQLNTNIIIESGIDWKPISDGWVPFKGKFDGNNKSILNLNINGNKVGSYTGLFAYTDGATISNLKLTGNIALNKQNVGGYIGYALSTTVNNCVNSVNIKNNSQYTGGIIGEGRNLIITNCDNYGTISGGQYTGGIIATNYTGGSSSGDVNTITNCKNYETVSGTSFTAGIIGAALNTTISECINNGAVLSTGSEVGGITGQTKQVTIANCTNNAKVTSLKGSFIGGIVGSVMTSQKGAINYCKNTSNGTINGLHNVAAIVGMSDITTSILGIENSNKGRLIQNNKELNSNTLIGDYN